MLERAATPEYPERMLRIKKDTFTAPSCKSDKNQKMLKHHSKPETNDQQNDICWSKVAENRSFRSTRKSLQLMKES